MILPKIVYDPGTGAVTLQPTYPAKGKVPTGGLAATRSDSITSDGHRQSVVERIDTVTTLAFPNVPEADLAAWQTFMGFALGGGHFDYYPDKTLVGFTSYELVDTDWSPKWDVFQNYTFTLNLRKYVA